MREFCRTGSAQQSALVHIPERDMSGGRITSTIMRVCYRVTERQCKTCSNSISVCLFLYIKTIIYMSYMTEIEALWYWMSLSLYERIHSVFVVGSINIYIQRDRRDITKARLLFLPLSLSPFLYLSSWSREASNFDVAAFIHTCKARCWWCKKNK